MNLAATNASTIERELEWFHKLILLRGKVTFELSKPEEEIQQLEIPDVTNQDSNYAQLIKKHNMSMEERLVLILALIPHVKPSSLDLLHMKNELYDMPFTEFGGVKHDRHKGYLPTGETAIFLLAGDNLNRRFELLRLFARNHFFISEGILSLEKSSDTEPRLYGLLTISPEYLAHLTTGEAFRPNFDQNFPAKLITTQQSWAEVVLSDHLLKGLEEVQDYVRHGKKLKQEFQFGRKIKPGYKVLFTGPPGTGKTLTASLLGKSCDMDVYRIDLSMVVSKYIGETEKNLSKVFDMAENKDWILFFDEADALFGKRSNTSDSHDRYANQEVSYLLQRTEDFNGLVILSSNFKKNIDEAFFRRFQMVLEFELPDYHQRLQLWENSKTKDFEFDDDVDLERLAESQELSAASIINILHYSILKCLGRKDRIIRLEDIMAGLKIEKIKEGKSIID